MGHEWVNPKGFYDEKWQEKKKKKKKEMIPNFNFRTLRTNNDTGYHSSYITYGK